MFEIFLWAGAAGVLFFAFLGLAVLGILRKSRKLLQYSLLSFLLFLGTAAMTGYTFLAKSYRRVSHSLKPRTGKEIYAALFGVPVYPCVQVKQMQDQVIPVLDTSIKLHFSTCPQEMERVLAQKPYEVEMKFRGKSILQEDDGPQDWFRPSLLGDTLVEYRHQQEGSTNVQILYTNLSQTEVYCVDFAGH